MEVSGRLYHRTLYCREKNFRYLLYSRLCELQSQADCFEEDNHLHPAEIRTTIPRMPKPQATHRTELQRVKFIAIIKAHNLYS